MKKWLGIRIAAGICAAIGWWGMLYPELALTPDTVLIKTEAGEGVLQEQSPEWDFDSELYLELLDAGPSRIVFRSRILADFSSLLEAFRNGNN